MAKQPAAIPVKDDRRIQKTKKGLAEALRQLIIEKGYDAVTVQDIIDRANTGRSTFYSHYESKDQLLVGNINFQEALIDTPGNDDTVYPMGINLSYLFHHTKEHLPVVEAMLGSRGMDVLSQYFAGLVAAKIIAHDNQPRPKNKEERKMLRYKAEAIAGGIIRMLFKWLEDGAGVPVDKMMAYAKTMLNTYYAC